MAQICPLVSYVPSEIILIYWFAAQETFLIIIIVENGCGIWNNDNFF